MTTISTATPAKAEIPQRAVPTTEKASSERASNDEADRPKASEGNRRIEPASVNRGAKLQGALLSLSEPSDAAPDPHDATSSSAVERAYREQQEDGARRLAAGLVPTAQIVRVF